jgi:hypothetical protein
MGNNTIKGNPRMKSQKTAENAKGQIILYKNKLEVRLEQDTVWLTQEH